MDGRHDGPYERHLGGYTYLGTWERVEYIYGFSIGEREGA
jgi:hypothetical protein